jgi:putative ABC transport system permease protein
MLADLSHSVRWLRQTPALAIAAVSTLAVAIGAAVAVFAVADKVLLRPLPIDDAQRIVIVWPRERANPTTIGEISYATFRTWQDDATGLQNLTAIGSANWSLVLREDEPATIPVAAVSASFFPLLGATPHLGRVILPMDDRRGAGKVAVLSYGSWVRRFGADSGIVGRQVRFQDSSYTIVGVMPEGFEYPSGAELWVPVVPQLEAASSQWGTDVIDEPGFGVLFLLGRLEPGVTIESARRRVSELIARDTGRAFRPDMEAVLTPLEEHLFGKARPALLALALCAGLVLLIASANVAVLLLVRAATRAHEAATRLALGASRWRIVRQSIADASAIASAGGVLGLMLAYWAVRGLVALAPADVPRLESVQFDGRTFLLAFVVFLTTAILIGLAPGLQASRHRLALDLTGAASRFTNSHRLRRVFVAVQVGLAFVLLVCAGLVGRSFLNLLRIDLGFNPTRVLTVDVELQDVPVARHTSFYESLLERVRTLPGVEAAAAVYQRPLEHNGIGMDGTILIEGQRTDLQFRDWEQNPRVNLEAVTPGYFAAMGTAFVQGRDFFVADSVEAPRVAIAGVRLASRLWPGEDPIGKRIQAPGTLPDANGRAVWVSIVGVVRDMRYRGLTDPRFDLYLPHTQSDLRVKHLMVRSAANPLLLAGAIRTEARRLEPAVLVENVEMMEDIVRAATSAWRFSASTLAILGALALGLSLVGIYATVSQSVVERTREIGIRVAVGAMPQHIRRLVLHEGLGLALIGVALGLVMALGVVRIVSGLLFDVQRVDAPTLTATALVLLATSILALGIPAWRAARVDPAVALRRP